jgi:amino acid adenylation domain-containing protein
MCIDTPACPTRADDLEAALRAHPSVDDCVVVERAAAEGGSELVAYLVPVGPFVPERLAADLREALPTRWSPCTLVPVSTLPLTDAGQTDTTALKQLPVIDAELARRWEEHLAGLRGFEETAVIVEPCAEHLPPLHLSDLLPDWKAGSEGSDMADALPAAAARDQAVSPRMAYSHGGPLAMPADAAETLSEALFRTAAQCPQKGILFVLPDGTQVRQTYPALLDRARSILSGLRAHGLRPGDCVILQIDSLPDHFTSFWGCVLGGIIPVTVAVAPSYTERNSVVNKLYNTWQLLGRPTILTNEQLLPPLRALESLLDIKDLKFLAVEELNRHDVAPDVHPSKPDDVVFYQLTSGSTGIPKCIQETHRGIIRHIHGSQRFTGYTADDVSLNWLPMDHVVPILTYHLRDVYLGCDQIHVSPAVVLANPLRWLDLIEANRVTLSWSPNFGFKLVSDTLAKVTGRAWDLSSMKFFMNAGEQVTLPVVREFLERVAPFGVRTRVMQPSFGMAEACTCMTYQNDFDLETGVHRVLKSSLGGVLVAADCDDARSVVFVDLGPPIPGVEIRITDAANRVVPEGVIGRFQIRGAVITPGYLNNDAANKEAFVGDGWFNSGDLGFIRHGRLTLTGREKEMIIVRGANFYCYEIEDVVNAVKGVAPTFVAACSVDDPSSGTEGLAIFFVPTARACAGRAEIIRAIRTAVTVNLGISPAFVLPIPKKDFLKTTSGKIQRTQMKKALLAGCYRELLKELDCELENENTLPDWFFRPIWRAKRGRKTAESLPAGCYLQFRDPHGVGAALGRHLPDCVNVEPGPAFEKLGISHYRVRPENPEDYRRLLHEVAADFNPPTAIVHLWTYGDSPVEPASASILEDAQRKGALSLLALSQALADIARPDSPIQVLVVSSFTQAAHSGDRLTCERTPLLGLVKAVSQEMPGLDIRHVDLPVADVEENATRLLQELNNRGDNEIAYRAGRRLTPRLHKIDMRRSSVERPPFQKGGFYVISGGLGGIGVELAKYLLRHYQARLLLLGRTPLPPREGWDALAGPAGARVQALRTLEQLGNVRYASVDICDAVRLRDVVDRIRADWRREVDGVIHLAGVYQERLLADETPESYAAVLRPKLLGTLCLADLVKDRPEALFVTFSSVMSFFGGAMFGAYAAANRFLESFTQFRSQAGLPSYCFAWSAWDEIGMSRTQDGREPLRARGRGFMALSSSQAIQSLLAGLAHDEAFALIGLDATKPFVQRHLESSPRTLQQLSAYYAAPEDTPVPTFEYLEIPDRFGTPSSCKFIPVAEMPRTPSGDIDRERLVDATGGAKLGGERVAPRTPGERRLADIWQKVLGVPRVGVLDNFFDLGGHSLLATQVVARLRDAFGVELPLRTLFEAPTVAALAQHIAAVFRNDEAMPLPSVPRAVRPPVLPLSFAQQRLWFLDQLHPGLPTYNIPVALRLHGSLDRTAVQRALDEVVRRHEGLRTVFPMSQGEPIQLVKPAASMTMVLTDLSHLTPQEREAEAQRLAREDAGRPLSLTDGPLFQARLLRLDVEDHLLVLVLHHIISDGWSVGVLLRELGQLYTAFLRGRHASLPELLVQYADFTLWQREWLQGPVLDEQLDYWKQQLQGIPAVLELPTDRPRPLMQSYRGAREPFALPEPIARRLQSLSQAAGATLFMTLLAAFKGVLHRYTGQVDLVVGTPVANRRLSELEGLVGFFVNTVVLRTDLAGDPTFAELVRRVRETALAAYSRQDVPFELLVERLQPDRNMSYNPLFQISFVHQNAPGVPPELAALRLETSEPENGTAKFDLYLSTWEADGAIAGYLEYSTDLFDAATIRRLLESFRVLLEGAVANPGRPLSALPLMTETEKHRLLVEWNATQSDYPRDRCVHELFEAQATQNPDAVAVVFGPDQRTYGELNRRANRLARRLRDLGVGPEVLVGLCTERTPAMVVAVLAVLKAGGAYVPLDPTYPEERLAFMLADSRASVLLVRRGLMKEHVAGVRTVYLDEVCDAPIPEDTTTPSSGVTPANPAYVIYTSGSTGTPKGVVVTHGGLVNYLTWCLRAYPVEQGTGAPVHSTISFDLTVTSLWAPLLAGRMIRLVPDGYGIEPLCETLRSDGNYSLVKITPAHLKMLSQVIPPAEAAGRTRAFIIGGENLRGEDIAFWQTYAPTTALVNEYGPTETVVGCCVYQAPAGTRLPGSVPIGRPIFNTQLYVLDAGFEPVAPGVPGELYIGGAGVARGYLGRPRLTAERFVPDPFGGTPGARLYRTGDRVRLLPDGNLEFLDRTDNQVKVRGYRIELGEIEAALNQHPAVSASVVTVRLDRAGDQRLAAYIVPRDGARLVDADVRTFIRQRLPEYMIPAAFVLLEALPLSPNGKIDRRRLPDPAPPCAGAGRPFVPPRNAVEEEVARIWQNVLAVERVGAEDNFFELGGHSLLATRAVSLLRTAFGMELPLRSVFETPTVAGLAEHIARRGQTECSVAEPDLAAVARGSDLRVSFAQQRLWFLDQLNPGNPAYNVPVSLLLSGPLRPEALGQALTEVVRRHEALRTIFPAVNGLPVQRILPPAPVPLPMDDLGGLNAGERVVEVRRRAAIEARHSFDLARGPLVRSQLLRLAEREHVLLLTLPHIVYDGWSLGVLVEELTSLHEAFAVGQSSPLPPLAIQCADVAAWQRQCLQGEARERLVTYWKQQLGGAATRLEIPTDFPRPPVQSLRGAKYPFVLPARLLDEVRALSRREGATLFMTLLASFKAFLFALAGQEDISIGSPTAGRTRAEMEQLIGFFINTLVLRTVLSVRLSFRELMARVRDVTLGAYAHQEMPFDKLVEALQPPRDLSRMTLFQVNFRVADAAPAPVERNGLTVRPLDLVDNATSKFDLALQLAETPGSGSYFEYSSDLFAEATIAQFARDYEALLGEVLSQPDCALGELATYRDIRTRQDKKPSAPSERAGPARRGLRDARRKAVDLNGLKTEKQAEG